MGLKGVLRGRARAGEVAPQGEDTARRGLQAGALRYLSALRNSKSDDEKQSTPSAEVCPYAQLPLSLLSQGWKETVVARVSVCVEFMMWVLDLTCPTRV